MIIVVAVPVSVKVPPLCVKFPDTFRLVVPELPFISKVPPLKEKLPATFMIQLFDPSVPAI